MNPLLVFLVEVAARSTIVLLLGLVSMRLMRRRSAAERHFVLAAVLWMILLIPLGFGSFPKFALPVSYRPSEIAESRPTLAPSPASGATEYSPGLRIGAVAKTSSHLPGGAVESMILWVVGTGIAVRALASVWVAFSLAGIRRRATKNPFPKGGVDLAGLAFDGAPPIFISREAGVPMLIGFRRPAILLPRDAEAWRGDRLRMVVAHELAHWRRRDHWMHVLVLLLGAAYWWHPFFWIVSGRLQRERELACDDEVLRRGARPSDYATVLVETARRAVFSPWLGVPLAMASGARIEKRIEAILNPLTSRRGPSKAVAGCLAVLAPCAVWFFSAADVSATDKVSSTGQGDAHADRGVSVGKFIKIETKMVEMGDEQFEKLRSVIAPVLRGASDGETRDCLQALNQAKGVDLMSAPSVTTRPDQKCVISIVREFRYPVKFEKTAKGIMNPVKFDSRNVGIEFEVTPTRSAEKILLDMSMRVTDFEGFTNSDMGVQLPAFAVLDSRALKEVGDGQTTGVLIPGGRFDERTVKERQTGGESRTRKETVKKRVVVLITARLVESSPKPAASPAALPAPSPVKFEILRGIPIDGKPGFVRSPYSSQGEVDVTGFPSNTEVKDPYTGKRFLVP